MQMYENFQERDNAPGLKYKNNNRHRFDAFVRAMLQDEGKKKEAPSKAPLLQSSIRISYQLFLSMQEPPLRISHLRPYL